MSDATEIAKPRASVFAGLRLTWTAVLAGSVLLFWLILALFGPWIAPHGEAEIISSTTFAPIGEGGLLGTDKLGRDVFSRLIYGVRTTLLLALITTVISFAFGVTLGFAAAILKGWFDIVVSRIVEGDCQHRARQIDINGKHLSLFEFFARGERRKRTAERRGGAARPHPATLRPAEDAQPTAQATGNTEAIEKAMKWRKHMTVCQ